LLATIKSRCTRITLDAPQRTEALEWLQQQGVDGAEDKLALCQGAPLRVLQGQKDGYFDQCEVLAAHLNSYLTATLSLTQVAKPISQLGLGLVLNQCLIWVHLAMARPFSETGSRNNAFDNLQSSDLLRLFDSLQQKKRLFLTGMNLNPQLVVEELLVELGSLFKLA
jgi:DNA polymerase-3 subunit delta'